MLLTQLDFIVLKKTKKKQGSSFCLHQEGEQIVQCVLGQDTEPKITICMWRKMHNIYCVRRKKSAV